MFVYAVLAISATRMNRLDSNRQDVRLRNLTRRTQDEESHVYAAHVESPAARTAVPTIRITRPSSELGRLPSGTSSSLRGGVQLRVPQKDASRRTRGRKGVEEGSIGESRHVKVESSSLETTGKPRQERMDGPQGIETEDREGSAKGGQNKERRDSGH